MLATQPTTVGERLSELAADPVAGPVTRGALPMLSDLFGRRGSLGGAMATRALQIAMPAARVGTICTAYMRNLLKATATA